MALIFLSYRRADTQDFAGRIYDKMRTRYDHKDLFFDLDAIPYGVDFREYIEESIKAARVVVAIMGKRWLCGDDAHNRLLADAGDFVRIEVELALKHRRALIPLLANGAQMPAPADLPESLHSLMYLNGCPVDSGANFHSAMERLLDRIELLIDQREAPSVQRSGHRFEVLSGPGKCKKFELQSGQLEIGRHPTCGVCLGDNSVSRHHAQLKLSEGGYAIFDLQSRNGVFVNGARVDTPRRLEDGDLLQIGVFVLKYRREP